MTGNHTAAVKQTPGISLAILVAISGIIGSFGTSYALLETEREDTVQQLQRAAVQRNTAIQASVDKMLEAVRIIPGLFEASEEVNREEFQTFTDPVLHRHPQIQALFWAPRVTSDTHASAESRDINLGFSNEPIKTVTDERTTGSNDRHADYYPIVQVNSFEGAYYSLLGMNLNAMVTSPGFLDSVREGAIVKMCNQFCAGEAYFTVKDASYDFVLPSYEGGRSYKTPEERSLHFTGFVIARFNIDLLVTQALLKYDRSLPGLDFYIYADASVNDANRIYYHHSRMREKSFVPESADNLLAGPHVVTKIRYSDASWSVLYRPAPGYFEWSPSLLLWGVLIIGLLLTGLFTSYILFITNQRQLIKRKVDERTIALKQSSVELNQANRFLDSIIDNLPIMIFVKDAEELRFVRVNKAAEVLMGFSKSEILGKNDFDLFPREQAEFFNNRDREVLANGELVEIAEEEIQTAQRGVRILHTIKVPVLNYKAVPQYLLGISEDITERKQVEQELVEAKQEAEAANMAKSKFLANMSHELRTPLNAIIGYSEMLTEDALEKNNQQSITDLQKIHSSGNHLLELINDVLDLSKIEAGRMEVSSETFQLQPLVEEVVNTMQPLIEKNNNVFKANYAAHIGDIVSDSTKLRQVLFNLLSNSAKFTQDGEITLNVTRKEKGGNAFFEFAVRDTGIGISDQQLACLFQPFIQADDLITKKYGGTGLGLSISKRFIELLGGEITVESELEKGTVFTVILPVKLPEIVLDETQMLTEEASAVADAFPTVNINNESGTVLVIDDEKASRDLLKVHLEKAGWNVVFAADGQTGLKLAREIHPYAITLDVLMPGLDGWSVLEVLKADPVLNNIPVVMCTILDEKQRGFALGATDFLVKPINRSELKAALTRYCNKEQCHLLVVEDDEATREMLVRTASKLGWSVAEAANGKKGLQCIEAQQPDLILLDLMMPEVDGFGVVEVLQKKQIWRDIPVIIVTAKDLTHEDRQRLNGYVETVMEKGQCNMDELLGEVTQRLSRVKHN